MDHVIAQALAIARRSWKYRWTGVGVAWLAGLIGAVVVFAIPDRYEASARIYVDTQSMLKPLMAGLAVQPNVEQQVGMLSKTLISRPNVEKLIRMADLDLKNQSKADQDSLVDQVMRNLSIQSTARDNLYTLSYRDTQPEVAKRVVQSMVSVFVESGLGAQSKDTATATTFINEQIKTYEAKLEDAENRLKEFRLRNIDSIAGDGKDSAARISELSAQLERARLEYREAVNARDAAKAQMEALRTSAASPAGSTGSTNVLQSVLQESAQEIATPEIDARLTTQRTNLDALLQRYTEQHPDVVTTRKLIKDLEEQKRKEVAEIRKRNLALPAIAGGSNPAAQEIARLLAGSEVQVAALRARVDEYQSRYGQALAALKTAPQLEAEASQLNRDYAINKKNYEDLVARRESASISGDLNGAAGIADFRLIDPPRASNNPVAPNRLLFLAGVMLASLLAGLFAAFAASQLRPVFHDAGELRTRLELPILGVVSRLVTDADRRRNRIDLYRFGAASGSLVALFVLGLSVMAFLQNQQVN